MEELVREIQDLIDEYRWHPEDISLFKTASEVILKVADYTANRMKEVAK